MFHKLPLVSRSKSKHMCEAHEKEVGTKFVTSVQLPHQQGSG